jgi:hypothetical protein
MITTYHPDGEAPPKYREVRDLNVNWNIGFGWLIIMDRDIQDKAIVQDDQPVIVGNTIAPKQGKRILYAYLEDVNSRALIVDLAFAKDSAVVEINGTNPARLDFFWRNKISSVAKIVSSDNEFDFNFSS